MDGPELQRTESMTGLEGHMSTPVKLGVARIDTEPMYTALKASIGEGWSEYKNAMSAFLLGNLNQAELSQTLSTLLSPTPSVSYNNALISTVHLHNILLFAIYSNIHRDPPPEAIASWVLATDTTHPSNTHSTSKSAIQGSNGANDKAEERLKREVMALSARDRRRIKSTKDNAAIAPLDGPLKQNMTYGIALTVPVTSSQAPEAIPAAASSLSKTNWDLEIRRRYAQPLSSETLEFPSKQDIQNRIEPICYEEGVGLSSVPMTQTALSHIAELVETATETFIKETLTKWFSTARTNAPGDLGPLTAKFRKQIRREEEAVDRGEIMRSNAGLLPCEQDALVRREPLSLEELRLVFRLDETRFRHDEFLAQDVLGDVEMDLAEFVQNVGGEQQGMVNGGYDYPGLDKGDRGDMGVLGGIEDGDQMVVDEQDWGWQGATAVDREGLMGVLDSVMAGVGS